MQVFRVEDHRKLGPYQGFWQNGHPVRKKFLDSISSRIARAHNGCPLRPAQNCGGDHERNCFSTLDDLLWWFQGFEGDLTKYGFRVSVYEVDYVYENGRQAIAKIGNLRPIKRFSLLRAKNMVDRTVFA